MKKLLFIIPVLVFLILSCSESDDINKEEVEFEQKEIAFLKDFREKVRGDWNIDKLTIAKNYIVNDNPNDSVILNFGRIFINNIYNDPINADKYNQLEASFYYNNEIIPFKSRLLPTLSKGDFEINGVFGLMETGYYFPFPVSSDSFSKEYLFLDHYFLGDNYIILLSEDEKTLTWQGNRFVREIVLTKKQ